MVDQPIGVGVVEPGGDTLLASVGAIEKSPADGDEVLRPSDRLGRARSFTASRIAGRGGPVNAHERHIGDQELRISLAGRLAVIEFDGESHAVDERRGEHDVELISVPGGGAADALVAVHRQVLPLLLNDRIEPFDFSVETGVPLEELDLHVQAVVLDGKVLSRQPTDREPVPPPLGGVQPGHHLRNRPVAMSVAGVSCRFQRQAPRPAMRFIAEIAKHHVAGHGQIRPAYCPSDRENRRS